ncbi:hypothetical protein D3C85_1235800 [compost metagenome]
MAETHSFFGFKITIISPASKGIGSVGISALPILVTIFCTSGKLSNRILDAFCVVSMVLFRLLPVSRRVSTAKSPSSNCGINSPPKVPITKTAMAKSESVAAKIDFGNCNTRFNKGWYRRSNQITNLSVMVFLCESFLFRNRADIMGT